MKRVLVLLVLVAACQKPEPRPPVTPTGAQATCSDVCAHLAALGCSAADPTANGVSCTDVCSNAAGALGWDLSCRASAPSCSAADACK